MAITHEIDNLVVGPDASLRECIAAIDRGAKQIALVLESDGLLIATVTDGDIRRGLIRGLSLDAGVAEVMHRNPLTVSEHDSESAIQATMRRASVSHVPVLDAQGLVRGLAWIRDFTGPPKSETEVVIMAGGLGTRLRPLTETVPKPMLPVGGQPLLKLILDGFIRQGFYRFTLSVNYRREVVQDYFGDGSELGVEIRYVEENQRMGTAGALSLLHEKPTSPFVVMNGDLLTSVRFENLLQFHADEGAVATMCVREYSVQVPYGVVRTDGARLLDIEEKPVHQHFVNAGVYVLSPEALAHLSAGEPLDMPSLFERLIENGNTVAVFPIREYWMDIGRLEDLERARDDVGANKFK